MIQSGVRDDRNESSRIKSRREEQEHAKAAVRTKSNIGWIELGRIGMQHYLRSTMAAA
jgi:hypothetical protein